MNESSGILQLRRIADDKPNVIFDTPEAKDVLKHIEELEVQLAEVMKWRKKWTGMCVDLESDSELQAILEKQDE